MFLHKSYLFRKIHWPNHCPFFPLMKSSEEKNYLLTMPWLRRSWALSSHLFFFSISSFSLLFTSSLSPFRWKSAFLLTLRLFSFFSLTCQHTDFCPDVAQNTVVMAYVVAVCLLILLLTKAVLVPVSEFNPPHLGLTLDAVRLEKSDHYELSWFLKIRQGTQDRFGKCKRKNHLRSGHNHFGVS